MKLLTLTLSAALISGAAYGQDLAIEAYKDRMRGDFRSTAVLEQLEEIQAQQRQLHYELEERARQEQNRCNDLYFRQQHERYLIQMLEDCE